MILEKEELFQNKYRIKSHRYEGWNYADEGCYFITICTEDRVCYFGKIENKKMQLSPIGEIAVKCWLEIPKHFPFAILDLFVVMPNHIHGILQIIQNIEMQNMQNANVETQNFASLRVEYKNKFGPQSKNLSSIIRGFKIGVKKYSTINNIDFFWQPRFYDRIIRNERELNNIRNYIYNNPLKWEFDRNNS